MGISHCVMAGGICGEFAKDNGDIAESCNDVTDKIGEAW